MNNLLRSLTESQVQQNADLRLLLTSVKEGRRQTLDSKVTDPFYDSLEGLLSDLRTVTIDNRDAEAFLKPVSKAEVPDYYDVIANPMDFSTMLKKVKQKTYKSKKEFKADLDLIWSNCFKYNAAENHPLRPCVKRLRIKAEKLLMYITDRKERADPMIPSDLPLPPGVARPRIVNGMNGHFLNGRSPHTPSSSLSMTSKPGTPASSFSFTKSATITIPARHQLQPFHGAEIPFSDTPAIMRTQEGMEMFRSLDIDVDAYPEMVGGDEDRRIALLGSLKELAPPFPLLMEYRNHDSDDSEQIADLSTCPDGSEVGDKRKFMNPENETYRSRKRSKIHAHIDMDESLSSWWGAVQSDTIIGNGLPAIPFGPSTSSAPHQKSKQDGLKPTTKSRSSKSKRQQAQPAQNPKSLLSMMNTNIKTMRRLRHTHAKFQAMNTTTGAPEDEEQMEQGLYGLSSSIGSQFVGRGFASAGVGFGEGDDDALEDKIDEDPWSIFRGRGKGKARRRDEERLRGIEMGGELADDCLRWANGKILEHAGFQGTSSLARDVLADVTAGYLYNVGKTIRFLTDKFGQSMPPEEIILHTLFESGSSKVQDLERYISDDVERYGTRLAELDKKLVGAYRETNAGEVLEDEGLFEEEDEEETGALALGEFADVLGEDYFGLKELGIAAELGMSSLTVPKRLMRGKKGQNKPTAAKPTEPPPPYPPPPPFIPLTAGKVDDQIGLLKDFYRGKLMSLAPSLAPAPPAVSGTRTAIPGVKPLSGPSMNASAPGRFVPPPLPPPVLIGSTIVASTTPASSSTATQHALPPPPGPMSPSQTVPSSLTPPPPPQPATPTINPDLILPDETPNPVQAKIGPIGQILKTGGGAAGSTGKKKATAAAKGGSAGGPNAGVGDGSGSRDASGSGIPSTTTSPSKKKKSNNPNAGVGTGNGRKKKSDPPPPPVGLASGSTGAMLPPVFASS